MTHVLRHRILLALFVVMAGVVVALAPVLSARYLCCIPASAEVAVDCCGNPIGGDAQTQHPIDVRGCRCVADAGLLVFPQIPTGSFKASVAMAVLGGAEDAPAALMGFRPDVGLGVATDHHWRPSRPLYLRLGVLRC